MGQGFAVEGYAAKTHFEWNRPVWLFKLMHRFGRSKKKCGVTIIDSATLTSISLVSNPSDATGYVDW